MAERMKLCWKKMPENVYDDQGMKYKQKSRKDALEVSGIRDQE